MKFNNDLKVEIKIKLVTGSSDLNLNSGPLVYPVKFKYCSTADTGHRVIFFSKEIERVYGCKLLFVILQNQCHIRDSISNLFKLQI